MVLVTSGVRGYKRYQYAYLKELYNRRLKAGLPTEVPRNKQFNWNYDVEMHALSHRISERIPGHTLQLAFTDKSYALQIKRMESELISGGETHEMENLDDSTFTSNQKLTISGQTTTVQYITEYLVGQLPHLPNDGIRALVDYLTTTEKLVHVASNLGMTELVLYDGEVVPDEAVANSLLALIQLIKTEQGLTNAQTFIRDFIITQLIGEDLDDIYHIKDGMAQLEQLLAKQERGKPIPRLIDQFGQETLMACYYVGIYSDQRLIGKAAGETAEIAKEMAARDALMTIYGIQDHKLPFDFDQAYRTRRKLLSDSHGLIENSSSS